VLISALRRWAVAESARGQQQKDTKIVVPDKDESQIYQINKRFILGFKRA
jgi:hypothetical protein